MSIVEPKGSGSFESKTSKTSFSQFKKKKKKLREPRPEIQWSEDRPKPQLTPKMWDEDDEEDLISYIDWHRRHPHCITPRNMAENQVHPIGEQIIDEENPRLFYTKSGIRGKPADPRFLPPELGKDCEVSTVSALAIEYEYGTRIQYGMESDDPWYILSVKDELEQSHIDGDGTTVRTKPTKKKKQSDFDREQQWKNQLFGDYSGGAPVYPEELAKELERRALADKQKLHPPKVEKLSVWKEKHVYSKFTANGTALDAYKRVELSNNIAEALRLYREEMRGASHRPEDSAVTLLLKERLLEREKTASTVKARMGTDKALEALQQRIYKLATDVSRFAIRRRKVVDTSLDVIEALENLRVMKLDFMLRNKLCDPNQKTPEDESIFLRLFQRANAADLISFQLHVGRYSKDSSDRKKMQRMLNLLLEHGVDVNNMECRLHQAAAHIAASSDNCKMLVWLRSRQANLDLLSSTGDMTPLMYAAMHGFASAAATLIKSGATIDFVNSKGRTALHVCGAFGQTALAMMLLRLGANKHIKDNDGHLAADIAAINKFSPTVQAIASFSVMERKAGFRLQYLRDHMNDDNRSEKAASIASSFNALRAMSAPSEETRRRMGKLSAFFGWIMNYFGGETKQSVDLMLACLEDDEGDDEATSYGDDGSWKDLTVQNIEEDVMLLS